MATRLIVASVALTATLVGAVERSPSSTWCDGLGDNVFDIAQSFTLAALNGSGASSSVPGTSVVLGPGSFVSGASLWLLTDGTTQPSDAQGTFNLVDGALLPISGNKVTDVNVAVGSELAFVFSGASVPAPHSIYCGVQRDGGLPVLAVNNDADNFAFCLASRSVNPATKLVYKPQASSTTYQFDTCRPVTVQIVGAQ